MGDADQLGVVAVAKANGEVTIRPGNARTLGTAKSVGA